MIDAVGECDAALRADRKLGKALLRVAHVQLMLGDTDEARRYYVEAASVGGDAIETLAPALPRGCGAALEVSLNGQQYEPLGTGGVAYTAVSDCGRGAHAAALVPPLALA